MFKIGTRSKALPDDGATVATGSAMAHGIQASEGSPVKYKLNCPGWHKPYAVALLEISSQGVLN